MSNDHARPRALLLGIFVLFGTALLGLLVSAGIERPVVAKVDPIQLLDSGGEPAPTAPAFGAPVEVATPPLRDEFTVVTDTTTTRNQPAGSETHAEVASTPGPPIYPTVDPDADQGAAGNGTTPLSSRGASSGADAGEGSDDDDGDDDDDDD